MTEGSAKPQEKPKELFIEVSVCGLEQSLEYCHNKRLFEKDKNHAWVFRAQQKEKDKDDWELKTHLEKAFENFKTEEEGYDRKELEKALIREFQRKLHHYTSNIPDGDDILEWLALMRHYGAPTRLHDWLYSFYVAVYFAVNECNCKKCNPEIWALNVKWFTGEKVIPEVSKRLKQEAEKKEGKDSPKIDTVHSNKVLRYLMSKPRRLLYNVTPFRLNERLIAQQGTFLCPGDIRKSFVENMKSARYKPQKENLYRIILDIDWEERNKILKELNRMNINQAVLFPDLSGFAESLKRHMAYPDEKFNLKKTNKGSKRRVE